MTVQINITCDCGKTVRVREAKAGRRGKCPGCGKRIDLPSAEFISAHDGEKMDLDELRSSVAEFDSGQHPPVGRSGTPSHSVPSRTGKGKRKRKSSGKGLAPAAPGGGGPEADARKGESRGRGLSPRERMGEGVQPQRKDG